MVAEKKTDEVKPQYCEKAARQRLSALLREMGQTPPDTLCQCGKCPTNEEMH